MFKKAQKVLAEWKIGRVKVRGPNFLYSCWRCPKSWTVAINQYMAIIEKIPVQQKKFLMQFNWNSPSSNAKERAYSLQGNQPLKVKLKTNQLNSISNKEDN